VGNIENTCGLANGLVLLKDAAVLDGHIPSAKVNEARAELLVRGKQRGFLQCRGIAHQLSLASHYRRRTLNLDPIHGYKGVLSDHG
jgi:hypothetical protein